MSSENKAKRRERLKASLKHNPIAKDLRTPKYKMRVVEDKRKKDNKHSIKKQLIEEIETDG